MNLDVLVDVGADLDEHFHVCVWMPMWMLTGTRTDTGTGTGSCTQCCAEPSGGDHHLIEQ